MNESRVCLILRKKMVARQLIKACHECDARTAMHVWSRWRSMQSREFQYSQGVAADIDELQRHLYGLMPEKLWLGNKLAEEFETCLRDHANLTRFKEVTDNVLPKLNP